MTMEAAETPAPAEAGAGGEQQPQQPSAPVNNEPAGPNDDNFIRLDPQQLESIGFGGNPDAALNAAKQYRSMQGQGWGDLINQVQEAYPGMSAWEAMDALLQDSGNSSGQQPAQTPQQPQPGDNGAGTQETLTAEQVKQMLREELNGFQQQQQRQAGRQKERQFLEQQLTEVMGLERNPQDVQIGGKTTKADLLVDHVMKPSVETLAFEQFRASLHPRDPQLQAKLAGPIPNEFITQAAQTLKPVMEKLKAQGLAEAEARSNQTPPGTQGGDGGARAQRDVGSMSPGERKKEAVRLWRSRLQGGS